MDLQRVRAHFDEETSACDAQILRIVRQYREQGELILEVLPFPAARRGAVTYVGVYPG